MDMKEKLEAKYGKLEPYKEFLDAMTEMFVEHRLRKSSCVQYCPTLTDC